MVRLLLVLAIGLPILIELVTFGGLVGHYVDGGGGGGAATPTRTTTITGAGVGDEILAGTPATERITAARVVAEDDSWQFVLTVEVIEVPDRYELRLGAVTTRDGRTVEGSGSTTGTLPAGESGTVTGTWLLPTGQRPAAVAVTATNGTAREYSVSLGDVPVSGG